MKFGICCSPERGHEYLDAGFDYVEMPAAVLAGDPRAYGDLPVEVTNVFFPGTVRLIGADPGPYREHARKVIEAAAGYGVSVMVLGSGTARTAPDGFDPTEAERIFVDIAAELNEMAAPFGIRVAPESLTRNETNVGNILGPFARALVARGLPYTADAYHVLHQGDDPVDWAYEMPVPPAHVHFASKARRTFEPDDPTLEPFFDRLKELGYDERISFEGNLEVPAGVVVSWLQKRLRVF